MIDNMNTLDEYRCIYRDMYKDAYGFRPRNDTSIWTIEDFEKEFEYLDQVIQKNNEEQNLIEKEATKSFELLVSKTINMGAKDRNTAIRWILDTESDIEHFEWQNCLPFGYLKEFY